MVDDATTPLDMLSKMSVLLTVDEDVDEMSLDGTDDDCELIVNMKDGKCLTITAKETNGE
ncbi:MAG: hypothetical protein KAJ73_02230 [Zetaproteobacteria bacterium]|nr:hypothetical protein [Zetaproteobacteria bacterium]